MSFVLTYDGQFFRVEIVELLTPDGAGKSTYVTWCSEAFQELKATPTQILSRPIDAPSFSSSEEARRHAVAWIKADWDARKAQRHEEIRDVGGVTYAAWLFKGDRSFGFEFAEFTDARTFAKAAEKSSEVTKVAITNNESPQPLTIWEKTT